MSSIIKAHGGCMLRYSPDYVSHVFDIVLRNGNFLFIKNHVFLYLVHFRRSFFWYVLRHQLSACYFIQKKLLQTYVASFPWYVNLKHSAKPLNYFCLPVLCGTFYTQKAQPIIDWRVRLIFTVSITVYEF